MSNTDLARMLGHFADVMAEYPHLPEPNSFTIGTRYTTPHLSWSPIEERRDMDVAGAIAAWAVAFDAVVEYQVDDDGRPSMEARIELGGYPGLLVARMYGHDAVKLPDLLGGKPRTFPAADLLALISGPAAILRQAEELVRLADAGGVDGHAELFAAAAADHEDPAPDLDCPADGNCYAVRQARAVILAASAGSAGA